MRKKENRRLQLGSEGELRQLRKEQELRLARLPRDAGTQGCTHVDDIFEQKIMALLGQLGGAPRPAPTLAPLLPWLASHLERPTTRPRLPPSSPPGPRLTLSSPPGTLP